MRNAAVVPRPVAVAQPRRPVAVVVALLVVAAALPVVAAALPAVAVGVAAVAPA
jgi:hypothetical protein